MISSITGFERLVLSYEKEITRLRALVDEQAEQIESLNKTIDVTDIVLRAKAEEREACAKLCDDWTVGRDDICEVAKLIRARGEPNPAFKNYMGDNWAGIV